jgi:hypothetical protein
MCKYSYYAEIWGDLALAASRTRKQVGLLTILPWNTPNGPVAFLLDPENPVSPSGQYLTTKAFRH